MARRRCRRLPAGPSVAISSRTRNRRPRRRVRGLDGGCRRWARAARPALEVAMRFAGNFNPEWGYLAPAPSFVRTVRIAVVAAAIGATAGAGVVLSLMGHPAAEQGSVAARTVVQPLDAAAPTAAAPAPTL